MIRGWMSRRNQKFVRDLTEEISDKVEELDREFKITVVGTIGIPPFFSIKTKLEQK